MKRFKGFAVTIILAAALPACSAFRQPNHQQALLSENPAASNEADIHLDFSLTNFTGTSLRGLYLSPTTSNGWEENVLGVSELKDGDTVDIRFSPNEKAITWDMRIDGVDGHYAEWKNLKIGAVSQMTLLLKPMPQLTVVAEVE